MPDDDDIEDLLIREEDLLDPPTVDADGVADILLEDGSIGPVIKDGKEQLESIENEDLTLPEERPLIQTPEVLPDVKPLTNNPKNVLSVSMKKGGALQNYVGNPIENDPLVEVIRNESSTATILNSIMEEMAEEAAFIKAWRNEKWNGDTDLSEATSKRIKMLKDLVDTLIEKEKLKREKNIGKIDFYGENFQRVLKHFLEVIQKTFKKVNIPTQFEDIFFTQLAKEFDNFEKHAEKIYYGKE